MPVDRITAGQFATEIANTISSKDTTQDTAFGPIRDIVIRPPARVFESQNERVRGVFNLLSLLNADSIDNDDLNDFVYNEGLIRNPGSGSTATVIFSRAQAPTADIPIPINFPLSTIADPSTGQQIRFITTESKTMYSSSPGNYFNATTGLYELEVAVASIETGKITRVGAGKITIPQRNLSNFDAVTNRIASTGGQDEETNSQLVQRYLIRILGTDISTPTGIVRFVKDFFSLVQDAAISYGLDVDLIREEDDAGAADLWTLGESIASYTETVYYPGLDQLIVLEKQPVRAITTVVDGVPNTYVEGTDFDFVEDTSIWYGSIRGMDGIRFKSGGSAPSLNAPLTITYSYNGLIENLQSFFEEEDFETVGRDLLFREGDEVDIVLEAELTVSSGDPTTVLNNVLTAISNYINTVTATSGGLTHNVEEFDINREVAKVLGVDNFIISQLSKEGDSGVQDIAIADSEYARITSANLNVTLA